jgi:hypothetical protein
LPAVNNWQKFLTLDGTTVLQHFVCEATVVRRFQQARAKLVVDTDRGLYDRMSQRIQGLAGVLIGERQASLVALRERPNHAHIRPNSGEMGEPSCKKLTNNDQELLLFILWSLRSLR